MTDGLSTQEALALELGEDVQRPQRLSQHRFAEPGRLAA
jgi:hypothetical protein